MSRSADVGENSAFPRISCVTTESEILSENWDLCFFILFLDELRSMMKSYIMSTEQTAFFLHKTTSEKRRAKAFGAFAGSVVKRT